MKNFNNQKSTVIIGKKNEDKPYNMDMLDVLLLMLADGQNWIHKIFYRDDVVGLQMLHLH